MQRAAGWQTGAGLRSADAKPVRQENHHGGRLGAPGWQSASVAAGMAGRRCDPVRLLPARHADRRRRSAGTQTRSRRCRYRWHQESVSLRQLSARAPRDRSRGFRHQGRTQVSNAHDAARRRFLKVLGTASGALIVGMQLPALADTPDALLGDMLLRLNPYVRIQPDGTIVIGARDPEVGQGIRTAEARIIAEELDADWPRVIVLPMSLAAEDDGDGEPRWTLGHQEARGSTGVPAAWNDLRVVGAGARALLLGAAAQRFGVDAGTLRTQSGKVMARDGRTLGYGELATAASVLPPSAAAPALKSADAYRLLGQDAGDVDARDIVTGRQLHAIDQTLGGALVAVVARCPFPGGDVSRLDAAAARALKGVEQVLTIPRPDPSSPFGTRPLAAGVAVLAHDTWTALRARELLQVEWKRGAPAQGDDALAA